ncbi:hypothetical protein LAUMK13_01660 [Mycobacterium innocens]|uniref:Uncharacterized protein n=2 Tax=Mycobacterium innocens TaxID=2341083 RepID=A0A498PUQ7_9MYCO|nr:hypothetical protein LAUMK13_01660 [Mycobacterium innocens]
MLAAEQALQLLAGRPAGEKLRDEGVATRLLMAAATVTAATVTAATVSGAAVTAATVTAATVTAAAVTAATVTAATVMATTAPVAKRVPVPAPSRVIWKGAGLRLNARCTA